MGSDMMNQSVCSCISPDFLSLGTKDPGVLGVQFLNLEDGFGLTAPKPLLRKQER